MNAAVRLEKKKVSQSDLRRLMNEQKQSRNADTKKIDSPFAKYENGQLHCVLCKSIVRSEAVWHVHVNASQHKENLAIAKELKAKLENKHTQKDEDRVAGMKRSIEEMRSEVPEKKLKGILKNSSSSATTVIVPKEEAGSESQAPDQQQQQQQSSKSNSIPDDFFDSKASKKAGASSQQPPPQEEKMEVDSAIPEGFFDDPVKDAKARNLEYKNPDEEEWAKFQKEIKDADVQSKNIINEDFEEATAERQIDEIDEQIRNWSRVLEMEKKKEQIESKLKVVKPKETKTDTVTKMSDKESEEDDDDDDDDEIPEFIDWRAKKSHK